MLFNRPPKFAIPSLVLLSILSAGRVFGQDSTAVAQLNQEGFRCEQVNAGRFRISLNGTWLASENNGKTWQTVQIPSSFDGKGSVIFKRHLFIPAGFINHNVFSLHVGNGGISTEVRINNEFVAIHNGAYSPVETRIPDRLLQTGSENVIEIICNSRPNPVSTIPLKQLAYQPACYEGLFRNIYITVEPPIYIADPSETISFDQEMTSATLESDIHVYATDVSRFGIDSTSAPMSLTAYATLLDKASGKVVAKSGDQSFTLDPNHNGEVHFTLGVDRPVLWSPAQPSMYQLDFFVAYKRNVVDQETVNIGFRKASLSGGKFFLNGTQTFIKSVNYIADYPDVGAALNELELEKDIAVIKTLGANAVRVVDYPPSQTLLNLCDRFGLMVFEEIPIIDVPPSVLSSGQYRGSIKGYLSEVIRDSRSHPAVVAISVGTDLEESSTATKEYLSSAADLVHNRTDWLVYYTPMPGLLDTVHTDADFVGLDLSPFTSEREMKLFLARQSEIAPNTTFWISAVGSQTQISNHNGYSDPLSLEHQARFLVDAYSAVEKGNFAGISINSFADWRGAVPHLMPNGHPYLYTYGIVSYWREKRPAFSVVRGLFNEEALPTLPIGNYTDTPPIIYVILSTLLLVLITYLHYSRRWFRESATRAIFRPYNFFADVRDQRMISAFQTGMVLLLISAGMAIYLSSLTYAFRNSYTFDRLLGIFIPYHALKIKFDYLVWHPAAFIAGFTVLFMVVAAVVTIIIKLLSFAVKIRLELVSAFTIAIWSLLPMAILILADMILFRLLGQNGFVWAALLVFAALCLLSLFRLFHGIGIIYDISTLRIGVIGTLVLVALLVLLTLYYNGMDGLIPYTKMFYKFIVGSRVA